jgi:hypothetical protein
MHMFMRKGQLLLMLLTIALSVPSAQEPLAALNAAEFAALQRRTPTKRSPSTEWVITLPAAARRGQVVTLPPGAERPLGVPLARERAPQLASDRVVVVAVDSAGGPIDWRIVADPRVVRAESSDAAGLLSGTDLTYLEAELRVAIAESADTRELRIYKPRWTGDSWVLDPIAASRVR